MAETGGRQKTIIIVDRVGDDGGHARTIRGHNGNHGYVTNGYAINARHCGELCHEMRTQSMYLARR